MRKRLARKCFAWEKSLYRNPGQHFCFKKVSNCPKCFKRANSNYVWFDTF